jgi:membrane protein
MAKLSIKGIWQVLKDASKGFVEDKVPKLSASLAYYTVFSLGPLLIMIIFISSIFWGREAIEGSIYSQMNGFVGAEAAKQMQEIVKNASLSDKGTAAAIIGVIFLLIGATGVFGEIQDSINGIWGLKPKPKGGFMKLIKTRLLSFGIIGSLGFLLLVSLAVTAVVEGLNKKLQNIFPDVTVVIFYIINILLTLGVVTLLFAVIFKVLPDAKLKWKDVWAGSIFTAILFMIGKFAISFYISKSDVGSTYGTAGSLIVILLWIYFSSIILYFGAEFTKAYVVKYGATIQPNVYAVFEKDPAPGEAQDPKKKEEATNKMKEEYGVEAKHKEESEKDNKDNKDKKNNKDKKKKERQEEYEQEPVYEETGAESESITSFRHKPKPLAADGLFYDKVEEKKPTGIATVLAGLVVYFISTATDEAERREKKTIKFKADFDN